MVLNKLHSCCQPVTDPVSRSTVKVKDTSCAIKCRHLAATVATAQLKHLMHVRIPTWHADRLQLCTGQARHHGHHARSALRLL